MIETERLILRPWCDSDAEALFRYASDPEVGLPAGWPPHTSVEESRAVIRDLFSPPEVYAVVLKATGEPVGCCGLAARDGSEAEIGYWVGKPFWGRGLIPEAVGALLDRCFSLLGLDTVWCAHYDGNSKSKRVCEKCGFTFHHTVADIPTPLGDIRTEHRYRLTKSAFLTPPAP